VTTILLWLFFTIFQ